MLLGSVLILAALAIVAPWVSRGLGRFAGLGLAIAPAALFGAVFAPALPGVAAGDLLSETTAWVPQLGIDLAFRLDGLSLLFALLITGIGSLIVAYAGEYLKDDPNRCRFFAFFLGFMTAMLGLVLTDNLLLLFIFWELTSITSYLLIGYFHDDEKARKSALQALVTTGLGGLAMLAGLFMLGLAAGDVAGVSGGVWNLSEIMAVEGIAPGLAAHPLFWGILGCVLLGAFTKSAQFPFHFWLPNAMTGPTPVSAFLHSSTMVKAGVYLLLRLNPAFEHSSGGHAAWPILLAVFGGVTMLTGAILACRETQLKKILAYSTVSSLGIMVLFTGVGGKYGMTAALAYLFAHALFKAALFLIAGTVTHETGSKDVEKLGGLAKAMPVTAVCGAIAAASLAGVPPLFGFIGKETLLKGAMKPVEGSPIEPYWWVILAAVVVAAALTVFAAFMVGWRPFYGPQSHESAPEAAKKAHEPDLSMLAGPALLVVLTAAIPFAPSLFAEPIVDAGVAAVHVKPKSVETADPGYALLQTAAFAPEAGADGAPAKSGANLSIWYPFTVVEGFIGMGLSALAIGLGWVIYAGRNAWRGPVSGALAAANSIGAESIYHRVFNGTMSFARWQTKTVQNGNLRAYIMVVLGTTVGLVLLAQARAGYRDVIGGLTLRGIEPLGVMVLIMMLVGAIAATRYRSRLGAIAALGAVGYGVAIIFVLLGVPDIAMTQFAIETLTVIIFVLVLFHLPRFNVYSSGSRRVLDSFVGLAFGGVMTMLVLIAGGVQVGGGEGLFAPISTAQGQLAYTEAFGKNVVNVILVDFRGLDTFGEIVVLGLAAIGVLTLLKLRGGGGPGDPLTGRGVDQMPRLFPRPVSAGGDTPPAPALADPDPRGTSA